MFRSASRGGAAASSIRRAPLALALLAALPSLASAQAPPRFVMSMSGPGTLNGATIADNELVVKEQGQAARPFLLGQALAYWFGDRNSDSKMDEPNDIDALEITAVPAGRPIAEGVWFSMLSDQGGFKDGDVLRFDPSTTGGVKVEYSEASLAQAMGANDGNIDIDAIAIDPTGALLFSTAEDETCGPANVVVEDGAVWILQKGGTIATVLFGAATMEGFVQHALGSTVSVNDVTSLEVVGTEVLFTVQAPTAEDATVFSVAAGGSIYTGFREGDWGFSNGIEADALASVDATPFPSLEVGPTPATTGTPVTAALAGITPSSPYALLLATGVAPGSASFAIPGFGALALDPGNALFQVCVQNLPLVIGFSDSIGYGSFGGVAPGPAAVAIDLAVQAIDLANGRISNPVLLELNQ